MDIQAGKLELIKMLLEVNEEATLRAVYNAIVNRVEEPIANTSIVTPIHNDSNPLANEAFNQANHENIITENIIQREQVEKELIEEKLVEEVRLLEEEITNTETLLTLDHETEEVLKPSEMNDKITSIPEPIVSQETQQNDVENSEVDTGFTGFFLDEESL